MKGEKQERKEYSWKIINQPELDTIRFIDGKIVPLPSNILLTQDRVLLKRSREKGRKAITSITHPGGSQSMGPPRLSEPPIIEHPSTHTHTHLSEATANWRRCARVSQGLEAA